MRIAILTISDRSHRGERADLSGPALAAEVAARGWTAIETIIVPDEQSEIERILADYRWAMGQSVTPELARSRVSRLNRRARTHWSDKTAAGPSSAEELNSAKNSNA